jgi:dTDP-glucose 4,6-dehydratase
MVTGGAGFIGANLIKALLKDDYDAVMVFDALTYAGNLVSLPMLGKDPRLTFVKGSLCDVRAVENAMTSFKPDIIMNLAAESHVDRSIDGSGEFIQTNIVGTHVLLEAALRYYRKLEGKQGFRFHHISTDEVFGTLGPKGAFSESTPYQPNSPYSASKAASDHLVRAWHETYGLPTLLTNCSNNYGPYQYPEKLIPLIILKAIAGEELPIYGDGGNIRDWLHVEDHARALISVIKLGQPGLSYNVGGNSERSNLEVVETICQTLDELVPTKKPRNSLIRFVKDRPGHDRRYAIDATFIKDELGFEPKIAFAQGIRSTIAWYLENSSWIKAVSKDDTFSRLGLQNRSSACAELS